tara:strand:+ start:551 stop:778 length:228 start_codon:yes stop_codon:yes gene_type:complete
MINMNIHRVTSLEIRSPSHGCSAAGDILWQDVIIKTSDGISFSITLFPEDFKELNIINEKALAMNTGIIDHGALG